MWHGYGDHFWGMHWLWWLIWIVILIWIFMIPWNIPGQRNQKETPLELLKKRFARGEISSQEYEDRKKILERD